MFFIVFFVIFDTVLSADVTKKLIDIYDFTDGLVHSLGIDLETNENTRIIELKEKLKKINEYVIDKDKYALLLKNITTHTDLNETNFYRALNEDEEFKFLSTKESKNLYLKLKERMNRDDIMKIVSDNGGDSSLVKSARKVMGQEDVAKAPDEEVIDLIVDKMLGEKPTDNHKFDARDNESIYWDPQIELEELQEHHKHSGRRIYRGERTTIRYYPFMVSIHILDRFWCGGVLYWHDLVLTSASCLQLMHNNRFFRENPRVLQVRVGSNHSRISGEIVDALEVYFHPGYNPRTLQNNIAVIRLRRHLYFNYHRIPKIISISHNDNQIPSASEIMVLGWGVTKISQKMSYEPVYLQRKLLPVYPNVFCKEIYGSFEYYYYYTGAWRPSLARDHAFYIYCSANRSRYIHTTDEGPHDRTGGLKFISESMFCAGTFTTGEGACDHDAGGPAILGGKLVGIISFGPAVCGYPNTPTVFTLVGAFADWIETINETMPGYYRGKARTTSSSYRPMYHFIEDLYYSTTADPLASSPEPTKADLLTIVPATLRSRDDEELEFNVE